MFADLPVQATGFLILFARLSAVLMLLPVFGEEAVPGRLRLLLSLGLTLALWTILRAKVLPLAGDQAGLFGVLVIEVAIGLAIGTLIKLIFQAVIMAGSIASMQVGLTSAIIFDPSLGGQTPLIAKLVALAAILFCMGLGLHHLWIAAIVRSYALFPVGQVPIPGDLTEFAVRTLSRSTLLAVSMAAPFLAYGIVFNAVLALSARLAPALQVFFIAQPLNLMLGVGLLVASLGAMLTWFADRYAAWLNGSLG